MTVHSQQLRRQNFVYFTLVKGGRLRPLKRVPTFKMPLDRKKEGFEPLQLC